MNAPAVTFRPAVRENVGLLIGLIGPSGSGKTFSAMRLAAGICGERRFAVIDTEAGRAKHYADRFQFDHADLRPLFRPQAYLDAIKAADAAGYPAIVVDSCSHEWAGEGGILEWQDEELDGMVERAMKKRQNASEYELRDAFKMSAWIKPKRGHKEMINRMLQIRAQLILCFRAEEKVEIIKGDDGKMKIVPKGWQPVCEKNMPYELTCSFLLLPDAPGKPKKLKLEEQHRALFPLDKEIDEEAGRRLAEWAKGGAPNAVTTGGRAPPATVAPSLPDQSQAPPSAAPLTVDQVTAINDALEWAEIKPEALFAIVAEKAKVNVKRIADIPGFAYANAMKWIKDQNK